MAQQDPCPEHFFDQLEQSQRQGGVPELLGCLVRLLREAGRYHELFEALKMRLRHRLGLPLIYHDRGDNLTENDRQQLEDGLLAACREVGTLMFAEGQIRQGWVYWRPTGDRSGARALMESLPIDEDRVDEWIEVYFYEGLDVRAGYQLMLRHYGTCNSITAADSQIMGMDKADRAAVATLLTRHVYGELVGNVAHHIEQQEGAAPATPYTLVDLLGERDWLFADDNYHLDTSHLSSTVRLARLAQDEATWRMAEELSEYGGRLSAQLQYPDDEPFVETYRSHRFYFRALLNRDRTEALRYFQERADAVDGYTQGTSAAEYFV
ncbi:MAG: hypothetical protein KDA99_20170, partial [Planctomycetales bacterium]|nr:hypothetical protein [Planctomycetales bacterium]